MAKFMLSAFVATVSMVGLTMLDTCLTIYIWLHALVAPFKFPDELNKLQSRNAVCITTIF
jgi:hypothetical protein